MHRYRVLAALAFFVLALFAAGCAEAGPVAEEGPTSSASAEPSEPPSSVPADPGGCGDTSGFEQVALSELPPEATETYELIEADGPYPYPQDGTVFQNREGLLPDCDEGYYHEFTVETPGSDDRGARRIVTGEGGEYFYTEDHYESFVLVDVGA